MCFLLLEEFNNHAEKSTSYILDLYRVFGLTNTLLTHIAQFQTKMKVSQINLFLQ